MKYPNLFTLVFLVLLAACGPKKEKETTEENTAPQVSLTRKWETDTLLTTCESVLYDKGHDVLYVSDINGQPDAKDGNGFISKVNLDGTIADAHWVTGLDAPKGMGLYNNHLYVADIDKIVEIDTETGKISNTYPVDGAQFLNDVTVGADGKVYVSDMNKGTIILLDNGKVSTWLDNLQNPNGLLALDGKMLMALWNPKTLNVIDMQTKQVEMKTDSLENPDGVEAVDDNSYLVSSWNGMVHYIGPDWKETVILDTRADSVSAADIEYIQEKKLLLVPGFFKNKVIAYELKK